MDPVGVAAGIIGIAAAAVESTQKLARTIDAIKDVPQSLQSIRSDLDAVMPVLRQLERGDKTGTEVNVAFDNLESAVKNCDRACKKFEQKLQHWTRHSDSKGGALADRFTVGIFGQERIKALKTQLSDCKGTLTVALSTATFVAMAKAEDDPDDKALMLQSREKSLQQKFARAETEERTMASNLQRVQDLPSAATSEDDTDREELLEEIRHQMKSKKTYASTCEEIISQLAFERTGHKIRGTKAKGNSSAVAGIFNAPDAATTVNLDISDTWAEGTSFAGAGVFNDFDFKILQAPGGSKERDSPVAVAKP